MPDSFLMLRATKKTSSGDGPHWLHRHLIGFTGTSLDSLRGVVKGSYFYTMGHGSPFFKHVTYTVPIAKSFIHTHSSVTHKTPS